jgi:hypothetical protein
MDIFENYDTTNMSLEEIMKLFKKAEWNEIKPVIKKKKIPNINTTLTVFSNNDIIIESPNNKSEENSNKKLGLPNIKLESSNKKLEEKPNIKLETVNKKSELSNNNLKNKIISRPLNNDWNLWSSPNFINILNNKN